MQFRTRKTGIVYPLSVKRRLKAVAAEDRFYTEVEDPKKEGYSYYAGHNFGHFGNVIYAPSGMTDQQVTDIKMQMTESPATSTTPDITEELPIEKQRLGFQALENPSEYTPMPPAPVVPEAIPEVSMSQAIPEGTAVYGTYLPEDVEMILRPLIQEHKMSRQKEGMESNRPNRTIQELKMLRTEPPTTPEESFMTTDDLTSRRYKMYAGTGMFTPGGMKVKRSQEGMLTGVEAKTMSSQERTLREQTAAYEAQRRLMKEPVYQVKSFKPIMRETPVQVQPSGMFSNRARAILGSTEMTPMQAPPKPMLVAYDLAGRRISPNEYAGFMRYLGSPEFAAKTTKERRYESGFRKTDLNDFLNDPNLYSKFVYGQ